MTPQPQHCNLEKICRMYHNRTFEYRKDLSCGMTCEHDTRSRPAPPAPNDNPLIDNANVPGILKTAFKEHDAQVAKSERLRVLNKLIQWRRLREHKDEDVAAGWIDEDVFIESLRSEQGKEP